MKTAEYTKREEKIDLDALGNLQNHPELYDKKTKDFLKEMKVNKKGNVLKVEYRQSFNDKTNLSNYGRMTANMGLQRLETNVRNLLAGKYYNDVDIVNCHYVILEELCKNHKIKHDLVASYNKDRDNILQEYKLKLNKTRKEVKTSFLQMLNDNKPYAGFEHYFNEIASIKLQLQNIYPDELDGTKLKFALFMQNREWEITKEYIDYFEENDFVVATMIHDGFYVEIDGRLKEFINEFNKNHTYQLEIKPIESNLTFPNQINPEYTEVLEVEMPDLLKLYIETENLLCIVEKFTLKGKTVFYINKECYWSIDFYLDLFIDVNLRDEQKMKYIGIFVKFNETSQKYQYSTSQYTFEKYGELKTIEANFKLDRDLLEKFRKSQFMTVYNENVFNPYIPQPKNKYNEFKGYTCKYIPNIKGDQVKPFLNHVLECLADGNYEYFKYIVSWYAYILQKGKNQTCLLFKGEMGCGKSIITDFFGKKILTNYYVKTDKLKPFFGEFNGLRENKMLCVVDELDKESERFDDYGGAIRDAITSSDFSLRKMRENAVIVNHFNNFVMNTNDKIPFTVEKGDRRFSMFKCSSQFKGRDDYFTPLLDFLDKNVDEIYSFLRDWDLTGYVYNESMKTDFREFIIGRTSRNSVEDFLDENLMVWQNNNQKTISVKDFNTDYLKFCNENGYDVSDIIKQRGKGISVSSIMNDLGYIQHKSGSIRYYKLN